MTLNKPSANRSDQYCLNINPFSNILFSSEKKWDLPSLLPKKIKEKYSYTSKSCKKDILVWFDKLTTSQKIAATAIRDSNFINKFLSLYSLRYEQALFNLQDCKCIAIELPTDLFFTNILENFRIVWLSDPLLYLKGTEIEGNQLLKWLNRISNNKIFEYVLSQRYPQQNLLWFNCKSFHPLQQWIAKEIETSITKYYFCHQKNHMQQLENFITFLKKQNKNQCVKDMEMNLNEFTSKSHSERNNLINQIKIEEENFRIYKEEQLLRVLEESIIKPKNRIKKQFKKKVPISQLNQQPIIIKCYQLEHEDIETISSEESKGSIHLFIKTNKQNNDLQLKPINTSAQQYQLKEKIESMKDAVSQSNQISKQPQQVSQFEKTEQKVRQGQQILSGSQTIVSTNKNKKKYYKKSKREELLLNQIKKSIFSKLIARQIQIVVDQLNYASNSLFPIKVIAFQRVRVFIQSLLPYTGATLFGSNAIGLSLPTSDIDILLLNFPCQTKEQASMFLSHIEDHINKMKWVQNCQLVANAKVPILKLQIDCCIPFLSTKTNDNLFTIYDPTLINQLNTDQVNPPLISVDISINVGQVANIGYESTQLMKKWMNKLPHLQKLLILFKHIFSLNGFNKNFKGGIGSYCLFVMIAAYLQTYPPSDQDLLYSIFRSIVLWYKSFDNLHYIIWLQEKGSSFIKVQELSEYLYTREQNQKIGLLRLIDPITSKLMSSSCNQFDKIKIKCQWIIDEIDKLESMIEEDIIQFKYQKMVECKLGGLQMLRMMQTKKCQDKILKELSQKYGRQVKSIIEYVQLL